MEKRILEFVHALRKSDIRISLSETLDAIKAFSWISLRKREDLRSALITTLIKKPSDQVEFDRLFAVYFGNLGERSPSSFSVLTWLDDLVREQGLSVSPLSLATVSGNTGALELILEDAGQGVAVGNIRYPLQIGYYSKKISDRIDWQLIEEDLRRLLEALQEKGYVASELRELDDQVRGNIDALHSMIRGFLRREVERNASSFQDRLLEESLAGKPFNTLSEREIEQMRDVVARLIRRLKDKIAIQERRKQRGRFDIRKTLRHSLKYGGVPMELHYREKKKKKAEIIALCDVSSSVWTATRFMLNLLYALQDQFSKVRSFVFVSDLGEVTRFFNDYEINDAIQKALKDADIRYYSYTDYGDVLKFFHRDYLGAVNSRTTFIIIGDGRNNHLPSQAWALEEIHDKARRVIWLNPETRNSWNYGDSIMEEYIPHCEMARECRNLQQLTEFIDELIF